MTSAAAQAYFGAEFEKDLAGVGASLLQRYAKVIRGYREVIIPFERSRVNQHQSIVFANSSLEQDKMQLMARIEQVVSENDKLEQALELQQNKLRESELKVQELSGRVIDQLSVIESLRIRNEDYKQAVDMKNSAIAQLQQVQVIRVRDEETQEKQLLLEKYQARDGEYHILLANCMRDKNTLAEKLNNLNEMEQALLDKDKEIKAEQFYLKKQWEEMEESKKNIKQTPKPKEEKKEGRIFKSQFFPSAGKEVPQEDKLSKGIEEVGEFRQGKDFRQGKEGGEILRSPLKKMVKFHQSEIYDFALNYNGNLLSSCGGDRTIRTFDISNLRPCGVINSNGPESVFISVSLDYNGQRLLSGSTDKSVGIYNVHSGKLLHSLLGHGGKVNSVSWTNSKERCVSGSDDKQMKVWDVERVANVLSVGCQKGVRVVKSNNVEPVVYTGHTDGSVRVYSISQGNSPVSQIKGVIDYAITSLTLLSNRHQVLATSLQGSVIHLLDLKMNKSIGKYEHGDFFNSSAQGSLSPSESLVLSGNCDGAIYYWNRFNGEFVKRVTGHDGPVTALNYHFMSSVLVTGDKEGSMILWQ